jgi:hypothetical protein
MPRRHPAPITKIVQYLDRDQAFADLGLTPDTGT